MMKYNELGVVRACILAMKFETYGDITRIGEIKSAIDACLSVMNEKVGEVMAEKGIKESHIDSKHPLFEDVSKALDEFADTDTGLSIAFMSPEQFEFSIKTRETIPTELLIAGGKYLVKK